MTPNAVQINNKRLNDLTKSLIKEEGAYFDILKKAYIAPIEKKTDIEKVLTEQTGKADTVEITWTLKNAKLAAKETQLEILETRLLDKENDLLKILHKNNRNRLEFVDFEPTEDSPKVDIYIHKHILEIEENKRKIEKVRSDIKKIENNNTEFDTFLEALSDNELGIAKLFLKIYKDKYTFDPSEGKSGTLYKWNGTNWEKDLNNEVITDYYKIADKFTDLSINTQYDEDSREQLRKFGHTLKTNNKRSAIVNIIKDIGDKNMEWEKMPNFLPCQNGVVDLKTGKLYKHNHQHYNKNVTTVNYNPQATCPQFDKFINEITCGDVELAIFLQQVIGYAICGDPKEEKVFYFYGEGRNGKGTLVKVLQYILAGYTNTLPSEMLLMQAQSKTAESASPAMALLATTRVAIFSEINKDRKVDSAKVKNLSGNDVISCRQLFSNVQLQIKPVHTMILQTNYKPSAGSDDTALWARNVLIPFKASFANNPNTNLKQELLNEAEGVLNWIVKGAVSYHKYGLQIPKIVIDETEAYKKECDPIALFLDDCCELLPELSTPKKDVINGIKDYCKENNYKAPTRNEICKYLDKIFHEHRNMYGKVWTGISLIKE